MILIRSGFCRNRTQMHTRRQLDVKIVVIRIGDKLWSRFRAWRREIGFQYAQPDVPCSFHFHYTPLRFRAHNMAVSQVHQQLVFAERKISTWVCPLNNFSFWITWKFPRESARSITFRFELLEKIGTFSRFQVTSLLGTVRYHGNIYFYILYSFKYINIHQPKFILHY